MRGRKPETINKELGVLRRMFNLALQGALSVKIGKNRVQGLKLLKVPRRKYRVYKYWEFQALYEAAPNHFKPILLCAYITGMRRSEIARLTWSDVNFEDCSIYIAETKNYESRTIPIGESTINTLLDMKKRTMSDFVFTGPDGNPYISKTAWKRVWSTTLKKARIEKCRFHDFRHTFCSDLIVGEKEDFVTVIALSGHKDIRMLKRYSHTHEEAKRAAIVKLGNRLESHNIDTYLDTTSCEALADGNKSLT